MRYPVKELDIGGILDQSIRLVKDHFKFLAILGCIPLVPGVVISLLQVTVGSVGGVQASPEAIMGAGMLFSPTMWILLLTQILVLTITNAICTGAAAWGVTHRYLGNDVSAGECLRVVARRLVRLIWAAIVYALAVGFGTVFCIIPGIYLVLALFVMYPVLMFENLSLSKAVGRSQVLMKGQKGKAFVILFLVGIISGAAYLGAGWLFARIEATYVWTVGSELVRAAGLVFNAVVATVVYVSARCHAENFDLELLTQMVEGASKSEGPAL